MSKKAVLPLLAGVVLAIASFGAVETRAAHCFSYCQDYAGWRYEGCTIFMDDNDDIVDVQCDYSQMGVRIAESEVAE